MTTAITGTAPPSTAPPSTGLRATLDRARSPGSRRLMGELLRFGVVGVAGFVVDAGVLTAGIALGTGPWFGRILSYLAAASATFALNRAWTFRQSVKPTGQAAARQWGLFLLVNLIGFACNYGTYAALIAKVPYVAAHPILGVAAGSLAGLLGNFLLARRFVFKNGQS